MDRPGVQMPQRRQRKTLFSGEWTENYSQKDTVETIIQDNRNLICLLWPGILEWQMLEKTLLKLLQTHHQIAFCKPCRMGVFFLIPKILEFLAACAKFTFKLIILSCGRILTLRYTNSFHFASGWLRGSWEEEQCYMGFHCHSRYSFVAAQ